MDGTEPTGELTEVRRLREVPRAKTHCGKPMRKFVPQAVTPSGQVPVYWICESCGQQDREAYDA